MSSKPIAISASRGAAILGISKYKTPVEVWLEIMEDRQPGFTEKNGYNKPEKRDPWEPDTPDLAPLRWGLAFEDAICDFVGDVTDREKLFTHKNGFLTCHVDGILRKAIIENKTTNPISYRKSWGEPGTDLISDDCQVQVQHQMICSGMNDAFVNVLVFPKMQCEFEADGWEIEKVKNRIYLISPDTVAIKQSEILLDLDLLGFFHEYKITANKKLQEEMISRYTDFWNNHILTETPPPAQTPKDLQWLIPSPTGEIEATEIIRELWSEYSDISDEIDSSKKRMEKIRDTMAAFLSKEVPVEHEDKSKIRIMAGPRIIATYSVTEKRKTFKINKIKKD